MAESLDLVTPTSRYTPPPGVPVPLPTSSTIPFLPSLEGTAPSSSLARSGRAASNATHISSRTSRSTSPVIRHPRSSATSSRRSCSSRTTTVFQVLVCAEDESVACFDETVVSDPEGGAWRVRVLHVSTVDTEAVAKMRNDMNPDKFFIGQRVITHWTPGRPEVEHKELNWEISDELYQQYKPAWGLKLLGWPVRGKYYTSREECSAAQTNINETAHSDWRCFIQLSTREPYNPEVGETSPTALESVGNTFVNQCVQHPGEFAMSISGDW